MFARYRLAFRHCYDTREPIPVPTTLNSDFSQQYQAVPVRVPFNPLHFGGKLFQQYCVAMFIRIEWDRIQWIKDDMKLLAGNYEGVNFLLEKMAPERTFFRA
jgi:hypothetical protein